MEEKTQILGFQDCYYQEKMMAERLVDQIQRHVRRIWFFEAKSGEKQNLQSGERPEKTGGRYILWDCIPAAVIC